MNYYSEYRHEERRSRGPYWDTNHYGLLALRNRESFSRIENRKENRSKCCKYFFYGPAIGFLAFLVFISCFWVFKSFGWKSDSPSPHTLIPPVPTIIKSIILPPPKTEDLSTKHPKACLQPSKRIVGYYKASDSQVATESQLEKLTHVTFKYAKIDENGTLGFANNLEAMKFLDLKEKVRKLKANVKVMISIEVNGEIAKKISPESIFSFLHHHNLHGIDIDWRHPNPEAVTAQVGFMKTLKNSLENSIISMTVPGLEWNSKYPMDLKSLEKSVDFFNVFSMNYYTGNLTGPPSPLFSGIGPFRGFNVDKTMKSLTCRIQNPNKLNMGVPFYGQLWTRVSKIEDQNIWTTGHLDRQIPWRILSKNPNFETQKWHRNTMTPFIYDSGTFLGFENPKSLEKKMGYLTKRNLGGVMIESIGDDDEMSSLLDSVVRSIGCQKKEEIIDNYECLKISN